MTTPRALLFVAGMVAVLLLAACGGGGGGGGTGTPEASPTPEGTVVTSDDGKLTLMIPEGALAEDVEVTATWVPFDALPEELQQLRGATNGYRLEPDGLRFELPVAATLTLDKSELPEEEPENGVGAYALVSFSETEAREILAGQSTEASLDDGTVVVRGELTHFSYIGLTRGSLQLELQRVAREHAVGSSFAARAGAKNPNPDKARLTEPTGLFDATGKVSVRPGTEGFITPESEEELNGEGWFQDGQYVCADDPGPGTYSVFTRATSVVEVQDVGPISTELAVMIEFDVVCVETGGPTATPAPPGATPTQPAGGPPTVTVTISVGCEHTQPGVESELQVRVVVRLVDEDGNPAPGLRVDSEAQGPGLIESTASGTTDENGEVLLVFRINRFGPYTVTVQRISLSDGTLAIFQPGTALTSSFTVEQECTPP